MTAGNQGAGILETIAPTLAPDGAVAAMSAGIAPSLPVEREDVPLPPIDAQFGTIKPDADAFLSEDEFLKAWGADSVVVPAWVKDTRRERLLAAVGKTIVQLAKDSAEARDDRDEQIRTFLESLYMVPPDRESPLGDDGANICSPMTMKTRLALHAFLLKVATGVRPYFRTEPMPSGDSGASDAIQDFYDSLYDGPVPFRSFVDTLANKGLDHGFVAAFTDWRKTKKKVRTVVPMTPEIAAEEGYTLTATGYVTPDGTAIPASSLVDLDRVIEVENVPSVEIVSYWDYVQSPPKCRSVDEAFMVGRIVTMPLAEAVNKANSGFYDRSRLKAIAFGYEGSQRSCTFLSDTTLSHITDKDADNVDETVDGVREASSGETLNAPPMLASRIELLEVTIRFDNDGDGDAEDWIITVETSTATVLRAVRSPFGACRNIEVLSLFPREDSVYGLSLPELMAPLQEEDTLALNMALDGAAMSMTVICAERPSARNKMSEGLSVGINTKPVDDPTKDVQLYSIPGLTQDAQVSRDAIRNDAAELSAVNETFLGVSGANTTATQSTQALTAGVRRLEVLVGRLQEFLLKVHLSVHRMMRVYQMNEVGDMNAAITWVTCKESAYSGIPVKITLSQFLSDVKFVPHGDLATTDDALRLQGAEKVMMLMGQSPLAAGSMTKLHAATRFFLNVSGVRNITDFIGTASEAKAKDEENAKNPGDIPSPMEKADPETLALYLSKNPDQAQAVLQLLEQISLATSAGDMAKQKMMSEAQAKAAEDAQDAEMAGATAKAAIDSVTAGSTPETPKSGGKK